MDSAGYAEHARRLTREGFVLRFSGLYLAVKEDAPEISKIGFSTAVVDFEASSLNKSHDDEVEILAIVKASGNPYPDRISLGRARNCDLVMREPSISKLHAHFRLRDGGFDLVDLDSANGTHVNGAKLAPHTPHPLTIGDEIAFGVLRAMFVDAGRLYDLLQFG
jgi:hypothetical protein